MKVSDYILKRLADEGVTHFFMVYGGAIGELMDAVTRQDRIKHITMQHEQAAGFAAEGYAKTTGGLGVAIATSGPGGGNLMTPIQNCFYDSVPVIFITGQVSTKFMRPDDSIRQLGFQETDIVGMAQGITKYAITVKNPAEIRIIMDCAIREARSYRPSPVLIDIPTDIQKAEIDPIPLAHLGGAVSTYPNPEKSVSSFLDDLAWAKRPVMIIGGGCRNYKDEFRDLAARMNIPAFPTWNALDIVTSDLQCYGGRIGTYGGAGRNFGIQNADLALFIGCRISGRITGGMPETFMPYARKYFVDADEAILDYEFQPVKADVNVFCDAGAFMKQLAAELRWEPFKPRTDWGDQVELWRQKYDPVKPSYLRDFHHYGFMRKLSGVIPENAIIVADTGGNVITFAHAFETKTGQTYFTNNGNTPMGFSMCGAIGAWFADPARPIFCLIGDGGMQLNIQELQTIRHYGIPIKIFVFNNHILGNTKSYQVQNLGGRCIACDEDGGYSAPVFPAIAKAYGIEAESIGEYNRFDRVVGKALAHDGPILVDVVHHDFCDYRPRMVRWDTPIEEMYPYLNRDEFRANMLTTPWAGWETVK